jgi:DnaA-homolog protein
MRELNEPAARTKPAQLALPLSLEEHAEFATLVDGANAAVTAHVRALAAADRGELLWIWGPPGCGKSHLLQAASRDADARGKRAMYLPLGGSDLGPDVLAGLDALDFLALDDLERSAGRRSWERALFDVLNEFQTAGRALLMAAAGPPGALGFALPDLASRAAGAIVYRIHALDDDEQLEALQRHARGRGLELEPAAARFLQARVPRDMPALCTWLHRLDAASLAAQRRITIPFIRASLAAEPDASG